MIHVVGYIAQVFHLYSVLQSYLQGTQTMLTQLCSIMAWVKFDTVKFEDFKMHSSC